MCNLSKGIYDEGRAEGMAEGRAEGRAEGAIDKAVEVVKNLILKGFSLDEALKIADIDKETFENSCSES